MNLLRYARPKLCNLIAQSLNAYYAQRDRPGYFFLPGQDAATHPTPTHSLVDLYGRANFAQQQKIRKVLLDLAGQRQEFLALKAVQELFYVVGSIQAAECLLPMAKQLNARSDLGSETYNLYGTALQVAKGFGTSEAAWDAVRELVGGINFPDKLAFDAFDAGLADHRRTWDGWFEELYASMLRVTTPSRRLAVYRRLRALALSMARQLTPDSVEAGLRRQLGDGCLAADLNWLDEIGAEQEPLSILASALMLQKNSPFVIRRDVEGKGEWLERAGNPLQPVRHRVQGLAQCPPGNQRGHPPQSPACRFCWRRAILGRYVAGTGWMWRAV
jgi:hypothetical protein